MKINDLKFPIICITILLVFLSFQNITTKNKSKRTAFKKLLTFSSKKYQDVNLRSFSLERDSHLIAKCPEKTVLIKMIFEKREKTNRIDVGFNCRSEPELMKESVFGNVIKFTNFDDITPPEMKCDNSSVFTGFEMKRVSNQIQFVWHCGQVRELGKNGRARSNMYLDTNSTFDSSKFSQFLIHTDFKVQDQQNEGIYYISFFRKPDKKDLGYNYGVIDIKSNDKVKK